MAWYKAGTVSVTNGSAAVVGVDTLWLTQAAAGDLFTLDGAKFYEVLSITDNTHLTLASVYTGTTLSAQSYAIIRNFTSTTNAALALSLADMINKWHLSLDELLTWLTSLGSVSLTNPATGAAVSVKTPSQIQAEWIGTLSKAITTADVALTATEASNAFIKATGALTANRAMTLPATQSHVIAFENSTTGAYTLTVKTAAGTGIVVAQGERVLLFCDGTNVVNAFTAAPGINAADVTNTPAGSIIATTVQAALNELDSEKAPLVSPSFTSPALGTPASGSLDNCTSNTETAANNSTQLATTAYADRLTAGTLAGAFTTLSASGNANFATAVGTYSTTVGPRTTVTGGVTASDTILQISGLASDQNYGGAIRLCSQDGTSSNITIAAIVGEARIATGGTTRVAISSTGLAVTGTIKGSTTIGVGNATPATSGAGITFPATQSASSDANTLDDYEEGTWTPALYYQNTTGVTQTYTAQYGQYTKIGNVVHFACRIAGETSNSGSYANDNIGISGLPFTAVTTNSVFVENNVSQSGFAGSATLGEVVMKATGSIGVFALADTFGGNLADDFGAGTYTLYVSGYYYV